MWFVMAISLPLPPVRSTQTPISSSLPTQISAPAGTPFTEPQYVVPEAASAEALSEEADHQLTVSEHAASMST